MARFALNAVDREMFALAVPALGALIAEPLYVLADTAVIGNLGTPQLGGLGLATQVISTVVAVSIFLAYGTTSAVSRLLGAGRERAAAHQAVQGLWIAVAAGVLFAVVCLVLADPLMTLLQASPEVAHFGRRYLRVSVFGFPAMLLMLAAVGYLRGLKDTRRPLIVALVTAAGNLALELVLVFGFGFGVAASAASTVVFQWLGAAMYLRWIHHAVSQLDVSWRPDPTALRQIGRDGVDLFIRTSALRSAFLVSAALAAARGEVPLAAHEIAMALFFFIALALDAVAIAAQAIVGTLLGAGDSARAAAVGRRLTGWGVGFGIAAGAVLAPLASVIPAAFTDDPAVRSTAVGVLLLLALLQPIAGATFALDGILIGAGDLRFLARAMVLSAAVFAAAALAVMITDAGIIAVWCALVVFMAARLVTMIARIRTDRWLVTGARAA